MLGISKLILSWKGALQYEPKKRTTFSALVQSSAAILKGLPYAEKHEKNNTELIERLTGEHYDRRKLEELNKDMDEKYKKYLKVLNEANEERDLLRKRLLDEQQQNTTFLALLNDDRNAYLTTKSFASSRLVRAGPETEEEEKGKIGFPIVAKASLQQNCVDLATRI